MNDKERTYAALAPVLAITGVFIHPVASALLPLTMFVILYRLGKTDASTIALRAADLVFTAQILVIIASLLIGLAINAGGLAAHTARDIYLYANMLILAYLVVSLVYAAFTAFRGRVASYLFSFCIAERLFTAYKARNSEGSN